MRRKREGGGGKVARAREEAKSVGVGKARRGRRGWGETDRGGWKGGQGAQGAQYERNTML